MTTPQPRNPLHGITLEMILAELVGYFGWPELGQRINVRCFASNPSLASSLKFLRRTPWAREKVESLYHSCCVNGHARLNAIPPKSRKSRLLKGQPCRAFC